ncbi:MAB_1171c family putative transporter [Streptomyces sp. H39-S7]|uniref:MAB_1171c family putative transporter n=1 Tax=Streptomyces sp. H39-S7 TaxID=3004357 RepID=UPI0022AE8C2A|nr:MAB_1171c family putative transporter [Streptomyces sp. H39-S7]MCZ4122668.1 hypothetical protein [Streptomyces sp. H39-S7]
MHDIAYPVAALVSSAALAYKLLDLRKDPDNPVLRSLCATLACAAFGFIAATPAIYLPVSTALGLDNLGKLVVHGSLIAFSVCVQRMLLMWNDPPEIALPRARRRVIAGVIVLLAMVALLTLAPINDSTAEHFTETYATTPYIAEYLLLYVTAVGTGLAEIARLCWRFAKVAGRPWLVRGLHLTAVGAAITLGYCLTRGIYVIARNMGIRLDLLADSSSAFAALGGALVSLGLVLPALGPRLSATARWFGHLRAYHQLFPLWLAVYDAMPDIALDPPKHPKRARWRLTKLHYRLYRFVIEIRDARHALREHLNSEIADGARTLAAQAGATAEQQEAAAEAAMLRAALTAVGQVAEIASCGDLLEQQAPIGGSDHVGELTWFVEVARAFNRPPVEREGVRPLRPLAVAAKAMEEEQ